MATENIILKDQCPSGNPVARSHARRILRNKDEFKEIIFDFDGIEFMGQGFALSSISECASRNCITPSERK